MIIFKASIGIYYNLILKKLKANFKTYPGPLCRNYSCYRGFCKGQPSAEAGRKRATRVGR